jgi:2-aminoadipate transaminase
MKRSFIREILEHTTNETISFAGGLPDVSLFPNEALRESAMRVLEDPNVLQYGASTGYEPLKEKIAKDYTDNGFPTSSDEILITSGSQQGLDIISRLHKSNPITIEAPSYLGAMNVFSLNTMHQEAIPLKGNGINIHLFKKSFSKNKLAYLIPDFQNPSGVTYSKKRRRKVAKTIEEYEGLLIEDSPYSKLYFEEEYKSISSLIPDRSYHLGSFSKTLSPALRIGWIRADTKLLNPLIAYKETMDLHTNGLAQQILNDYLEDELQYGSHLEKLRRSYYNKMLFFAQKLDEILPEFIYTKPKGGMFIYGEIKLQDTSRLVKQCLKKEVVFVPGSEFYINNQKNNEIRFNFTHTDIKDIEIGLRKIKNMIKLDI